MRGPRQLPALPALLQRLCPRLSLNVRVSFSPFYPLMEIWFLATAAFGFLSWGHLIFNNMIDLPALTPLYEN